MVSHKGQLLVHSYFYINDLNGATAFSKTHHFADDTNIFYTSNSLKDIKERLNMIQGTLWNG